MGAGSDFRWLPDLKPEWWSHCIHGGFDLAVKSIEEQCKHGWWQVACETCKKTTQSCWGTFALSNLWK
jgi:hypothetical protein